jgi:ferritin
MVSNSAVNREDGMRISQTLNDAINEQIGRELTSSNLYLNIGAYFDDRALRKLSAFFFKQADEERMHALKFISYLGDVDGKVAVPAVSATQAEFQSAEEAIHRSFDAEVAITNSINSLMDIAISDKDYAAQEMLRWFITEQVEEVRTMQDMLKVAQASGERNVLMVEAYLVHSD